MGEEAFKEILFVIVAAVRPAGIGKSNRNGNRRTRGVKYRPDYKVFNILPSIKGLIHPDRPTVVIQRGGFLFTALLTKNLK